MTIVRKRLFPIVAFLLLGLTSLTGQEPPQNAEKIYEIAKETAKKLRLSWNSWHIFVDDIAGQVTANLLENGNAPKLLGHELERYVKTSTKNEIIRESKTLSKLPMSLNSTSHVDDSIVNQIEVSANIADDVDLPGPVEKIIEREDVSKFTKWLDDLPPESRRVWDLAGKGQSPRQIAKELGISRYRATTILKQLKASYVSCVGDSSIRAIANEFAINMNQHIAKKNFTSLMTHNAASSHTIRPTKPRTLYRFNYSPKAFSGIDDLLHPNSNILRTGIPMNSVRRTAASPGGIRFIKWLAIFGLGGATAAATNKRSRKQIAENPEATDT